METIRIGFVSTKAAQASSNSSSRNTNSSAASLNRLGSSENKFDRGVSKNPANSANSTSRSTRLALFAALSTCLSRKAYPNGIHAPYNRTCFAGAKIVSPRMDPFLPPIPSMQPGLSTRLRFPWTGTSCPWIVCFSVAWITFQLFAPQKLYASCGDHLHHVGFQARQLVGDFQVNATYDDLSTNPSKSRCSHGQCKQGSSIPPLELERATVLRQQGGLIGLSSTVDCSQNFRRAFLTEERMPASACLDVQLPPPREFGI